MELYIRYLEHGDIDEVGKWLQGWGKTPIEKGMYPTRGLVMYDRDSGNSVYMGFVWSSDSEMAMIGFVTRNPFFKTKIPSGIRKEFLHKLIIYAKQLGFKYVCTWAESQFLVNDFKEIGLIETSDKCSELLAKLE